MAHDTGKRIVTEHIYPPIPLRTMDWCAYFDGEEELGGYGYGRTKAEAVADLLDQVDGADERSTPDAETHDRYGGTTGAGLPGRAR